MLAIALLSIISLGVSLFSLRVAVGAARSMATAEAAKLPPSPKYIGGKAP